jgi:hypothetical protein
MRADKQEESWRGKNWRGRIGRLYVKEVVGDGARWQVPATRQGTVNGSQSKATTTKNSLLSES